MKTALIIIIGLVLIGFAYLNYEKMQDKEKTDTAPDPDSVDVGGNNPYDEIDTDDPFIMNPDNPIIATPGPYTWTQGGVGGGTLTATPL